MKHDKYLSALNGSVYQRNAWMIALFISLIVNAGLTAALLLKKQSISTTFLPPVINQPFKLTDGRYSNSYIEQVATWFLAQTLNYTPSSYKYQMNTFLKHIDPELYGSLRQTLLEEFEDIKRQNRSSTFFVQKVRVKGMTAVVTGVRHIRIGSTDASSELEHWRLSFTQRLDGLVSLAKFDSISQRDANQFLTGESK